jgi:hypothetical protein
MKDVPDPSFQSWSGLGAGLADNLPAFVPPDQGRYAANVEPRGCGLFLIRIEFEESHFALKGSRSGGRGGG